MSSAKDESDNGVFLEVWRSNVEDAFDCIIKLVEDYPYIAMVRCTCARPYTKCVDS